MEYEAGEKLLRKMQTGRTDYCGRCRLGAQITVEDADWENRLLWKMQTVRTYDCGLWRLDAQFTVENGDWKRKLL